MRKRGASGGGTLRRKSPQQGQRPSLSRGVMTSGAALTWGLSQSRHPEAGPLRQQGQFLLVIHGLPRDKFLGKDIHSAKDGQLDEKSHKIQIPEHQHASLSHPVANALEMDWHLGPVKAGTVVMAEVVSFVHKVHLIQNGHGISKIIFNMFWVAESVLHP